MPQYFASILAFAAVVVGIFGNTWDDATHKATIIGWSAIAVGAVSMAVSIVATYKDRLALDWQAAQREKVRHAALLDLRDAASHLISPLGLLYENVAWKYRATMSVEHDRFYSDAAYMREKLLDPKFLEGWKDFDLRSHPTNPSIYPSSTWWEYFSDNAIQAGGRFDTTVSKYSAYLNAEELLLIRDVQTDDFFRMRLAHLKVLVEANERMPMYAVQFAFAGHPEHSNEYARYVQKLFALINQLPPRPQRP